MIYLFLKQACKELEIATAPQMPHKTLERLLKYSWPGNVRELENLIKRGLTLYPQGPLLLDELLPQDEGWYIEPSESQSYFDKCIDARVETVLEKHLSRLSIPKQASASSLQAPSPDESFTGPAVKTWEDAMRDSIKAALDAAHGKIYGPGGAAELLAINPSTLRSKMRKLGIVLSKG